MRLYCIVLLAALVLLASSSATSVAATTSSKISHVGLLPIRSLIDGNADVAHKRMLRSVETAGKDEDAKNLSANDEERGVGASKTLQDVLKHWEAQTKQTQKNLQDLLKQWEAHSKQAREFKGMIKNGWTPSKLYLEYGFNNMRIEQRYADPRYDYWAQFREFFFGWKR